MQSLIVLASLVFELAWMVKVSGRPSPKLGPRGKIYIFGISLKGLSTIRILFNLKNMKICSLFSSVFVIKHVKV